MILFFGVSWGGNRGQYRAIWCTTKKEFLKFITATGENKEKHPFFFIEQFALASDLWLEEMSDTKRTREEWIVLRCQLGDLAAYKELVELMEKRLFYYIRRFIRNETDAYDVLQEVWLAVFLKIRQLRETKAFRPWIYRIAHDKAVSQIRQEISQAKVQEDVAEQISSQDEEPAWNPEQIARIHKTLGKINPLYREVLTLYFLEEMKYEEIAHVVGCSVGTVKSRIHYAKEDLRRLMEAKNDD